MIGKVSIVGAGPGDPGLITVRGLRSIREADVVVYDRLVDPRLLEEAPLAAEKVYAGKESGDHSLSQDTINEILAMHALLGRNVVRLKGGDPFVFGRGGEEAAFLAQRGIPFEIVPGVSSAIAVPAFAGIPLTYRGISNSFAVVTGHSCSESASVDYAGLLRAAGAIVILMGVAQLSEIVRNLLDGGIDPAMPLAAIEQGTGAAQRTTITSLKDARGDCAAVRSPAVIVVGQVVSLHKIIQWFSAEKQTTDYTDSTAPVMKA